MSTHPLLLRAQTLLRDEIAPRAAALDRDPEALRWALQQLCDAGLMALRRPAHYGGPALSELEFRDFQEAVARYSGALAFLQTQHQSAVSLLSKSDNEALQAEYLPEMADGGRLMGIGFSQLRRPGEPICRATAVSGGYRIDGHVPWVTGWSFYPEFLLGAALPDGRAVFGVVPLRSCKEAGGRIGVGEPMRLCAMEAALTVTADFDGWFMPDSRVVFVQPAGWIVRNDQINITLQAFFALGCARGSLDVVEAAWERRRSDFIRLAADRLSDELDACRAQVLRSIGSTDMTEASKLALRAWAIELCTRCAHAAITVSGGAANSVDHPAQRLFRESLVYTVSAQTTDIMRETLARLSAPRVGPNELG
jgi:alkylation response protein AidB-like acyl-CoA dehydrogenase